MKFPKTTLTNIIPQKANAFETLALGEHSYLQSPGKIPLPSEENIIEAKQWVDENEK